MSIGQRQLPDKQRAGNWTHVVSALSGVITGYLVGADAHFLLMLAAGRHSLSERSPTRQRDWRVAVIIPAHNEEAGLSPTIDAVFRQDYPAEQMRVIVVADNCTDGTAGLARRCGAEVWERTELAQRGKGFALAWAFDRILNENGAEAVVVLDADCVPSPNLLSALIGHLDHGALAVQARYLISNPSDTATTALRWAGFALFNVLRPAARFKLGLSAGLLGTGMAFRCELLRASPWGAFSYAEDREQHLRWALAGVQVHFAADAEVLAAAVRGGGVASEQEARWESGRVALAKRFGFPLLIRAFRTRSLAPIDAAIEPMLVPQSVLLALHGAWLIAAASLRRPHQLWIALAASFSQVLYVVLGLKYLNAPGDVWVALGTAPKFVVRRLAVVGRGVLGHGPSAWNRTQRESDHAAAS